MSDNPRTWADSTHHRGQPLLLPRESERSKLIRRATENGWSFEPNEGDGIQLRHADGWGLFVHYDFVGKPSGGSLQPPDDNRMWRTVTKDEVQLVLEGLRCDCPEHHSIYGYSFLVPLKSCGLSHAYAKTSAAVLMKAEAL